MQDSKLLQQGVFWGASLVALVFTVIWSWLLGAENIERASLALTLCSASFSVGSLLGFIFTIFGDEVESLGKIRDAMIALASGITGIGIAKAKDFGALLGSIHIFTGDPTRNSSFSVLLVLTYFVAGFYFMYLLRKLVLNLALDKSRIAMERIKISSEVGEVARSITEKLPQSLLLGRQFIEEVTEGQEAPTLRSDIFSEDVETFLTGCEKDTKTGTHIRPENVAMAARLQYYRVYFEKENTDARLRQEEKAIDWISRALIRDPTNPDFQIKLADIFGMQGRYVEAVSIMERIERDDSSPQYVQQWLGYFLLFIDGREHDAIEHSLAFHKRFPDEASGIFNASCGYAQLYTIELQTEQVNQILGSRNRLDSLKLLEQAVRSDSDLRALARKHSEPGDSFESLAADEDFLRITAAPHDRPSPQPKRNLEP